MGVHIEWITWRWIPFWRVGILRLGKKFKIFGDPFDFACVAVKIFKHVIFKGASSDCMASLIRERKVVKEMLQAVGIKRVRWVRKTNGQDKWFEREI